MDSIGSNFPPSEGRGCWFDPSRAHQDLEMFWVIQTQKNQGPMAKAKGLFSFVRSPEPPSMRHMAEKWRS